MAFELGDEYTGPKKLKTGKVINMDDGTYVEGGVRYIWTGEGENFIPEGGWGAATPDQIASDVSMGDPDSNPVDAYGNSLYTQGTRAGDSASTDAFKQWTLSQQQATAAAAAADLQSAREILAGMMEEFGLPSSLTDLLNAELVRGESPTALAMRIRTTDEYKARFPGMVSRRTLGLPAITEAEYLDLESQYRSIMRAANLPPTFHDAPEDFTTLIAGDVSGQELQQRVALAESARETANQDIITELQDNYGLTEGDITAYYLDPGAAKNIFEERRMYEAAGLSVAATQAIGEGLEVKTAEALQRENIQRREIQARLGQRAGLTEDLLGSEGMSATGIAEAEFGLDVDEATRLRRLREARLAPMMGGGSALTTAKGITGLGAAE